MLSTKNLKLRKASKKLSNKFIGPFRIEERIGKNAYQLVLPKQYGRLHPTFHVSLLQAYHHRPGTEPPQPAPVDAQEQVFQVEQILDAQGKGARSRWLIKWAGWGHEHNTWEPRKNLIGSMVLKMVREFD